MTQPPSLSLAGWVVLTVLDGGPTHGFAIAALTAPEGELGRVWQVPAPVVYRSLGGIESLRLAKREAVVRGRGPRRQLLSITPLGHRRVAGWLGTPVSHVREVRSHFLVKLALIDRRGEDPADLVAAQRDEFSSIAEGLLRQDDDPQAGFDGVLAAWRRANVTATMSFLDRL